MNSFRTALEDAKQRAGSGSITHAGTMFCTLIEVRPRGSVEEPYWIQLHAGMLNMQFLHAEDPVGAIFRGAGELPDSVQLVDWEKDLYCTFDIADLSDEQAFAMVEVVLHSYFGLGSDYEWKTELDELS